MADTTGSGSNEAILRAAGLRITRQRRVILDILQQDAGLSVADVAELVTKLKNEAGVI